MLLSFFTPRRAIGFDMGTLKSLSRRSLKRHERYRPASITYRGLTVPCVMTGHQESLDYDIGGYHDSESISFYVRDDFADEITLTADSDTVTADSINFTADGSHVAFEFHPEDEFEHVETGEVFRISSATHDVGGGHWRVTGRQIA